MQTNVGLTMEEPILDEEEEEIVAVMEMNGVIGISIFSKGNCTIEVLHDIGDKDLEDCLKQGSISFIK
jgi:hypothetical protein